MFCCFVSDKLVFIYFLFNLFNVSLGSSGYDSLDPWGDGPSVFSNKKQVDLAIVPPSSEKKCITSKQDSFNNAEIMPYYKRLLNMIFRQSAFKVQIYTLKLLVISVLYVYYICLSPICPLPICSLSF